MSVDGEQFLRVAEPALQQGCADRLAEAVQARWTAAELCPLLSHEQVNVRRVAAVTLGLIGDRSVIDCLARALHDEDQQVTEMAEHGLWAIWFRLCCCDAAEPFQQGVSHLEAERYDKALTPFHRAQAIDPEFAEAYNQCAIAHFFLGQYEQSIVDCQSTLEKMPCHFGAMAGLGHCYTHLGKLDRALECYRQTLAIHPRMAGVQNAIDRIERKRAQSGGADDPSVAHPRRG
jgi:tetratricopeptide (TPR) repeat protein